MSKIFVAALALTLAAGLTAACIGDAQAGDKRSSKNCPSAGYCPHGTCAKDGSTHACNPKYCRAKYCH